MSDGDWPFLAFVGMICVTVIIVVGMICLT